MRTIFSISLRFFLSSPQPNVINFAIDEAQILSDFYGVSWLDDFFLYDLMSLIIAAHQPITPTIICYQMFTAAVKKIIAVISDKNK